MYTNYLHAKHEIYTLDDIAQVQLLYSQAVGQTDEY